MAPPLIFAHRGASAELPENTLAAFRRAIALEADGIELDVQVTRDGVPVVFHDTSLRRLTGTPGHPARKTWAELRRLTIHGREPIPRLADVLRLTRGLVVVQIELKSGPVAPVIRAIRSARAEQWVILASFHARLVAEARTLAPAIPRMLISEGRSAPATLVRHLAACGAGGLSVSHRAIRSAAWVGHFHARGYAVWSWTVNDPALAARLAGWGVDALLGDDPALLKSAV
ncbi:Glycerophosphoryl diester phosphodiesterase [Lacunisphaera limnophila]|uniref:Glycerophosphoryl diester phosphodiesterase n=1 Tax=Lacunisphaera limnophila TaxID=1838286 RepID=A0A1D8ASY6_9BACT|nr:glycerophosphodiester phosphodiesterase [Lacunisphaera limnophila]AOS44005.1 Glycerophosphoryl diester phosphodiesterase [Lacunisphaera limnophila]